MRQRHPWLIGSTIAFLGLLGMFMVGPNPAKAAVPELKAELRSCIEEAWGSERFAELMATYRSGRTDVQPTAEELAAGEACIADHQPELTRPQPTASSSPTATQTSDRPASPAGKAVGLSDDLQACLKAGIPNFDSLLARAQAGEPIEPTAEMRAVGERCAAAHGAPTLTVPVVKTPALDRSASDQLGQPLELYRCMEELFGTDRFAAMKAGRVQPTAEEIRRAEAECLSKHQLRPPAGHDETAADRPVLNHSDGEFGLTNEQKACMARILGNDFEAAKSGGTVNQVKYRQVAKECFGASDADVTIEPAQPPDPTTLPRDVIDCKKKVFGEAVAARMLRGEYSPDDHQRFQAKEREMRACLDEAYGQSVPVQTGTMPNDIQSVERPSDGIQSVERPSDGVRSQQTQPLVETHTHSPDPSSTYRYDAVTSEQYLEGVLGSHYRGYRDGSYLPTNDQYHEMAACFRRD